MRSFLGRDILSLKDFERAEFFRVFQAAKDLGAIARDRRNSDMLRHKTLVTAFYQHSTRTRLVSGTLAARVRTSVAIARYSAPEPPWKFWRNARDKSTVISPSSSR